MSKPGFGKVVTDLAKEKTKRVGMKQATKKAQEITKRTTGYGARKIATIKEAGKTARFGAAASAIKDSITRPAEAYLNNWNSLINNSDTPGEKQSGDVSNIEDVGGKPVI